MMVSLRLCPITGLTNGRFSDLQPVLTVFARPRLGSITRAAKQHVLVCCSFPGCLAADFIRDAMVNLQITFFIFSQADTALAAVFRYEFQLELF
jgi:hypothetical protein